MATIDKKIKRIIGKNLYNNKMIEENDKILVAVSGGKDSLTMLYDFKNRIKSYPINFEYKVIHVISDIAEVSHKDELEALFLDWKIPYVMIEVDIIKRMKDREKDKLNCYWCAMQRRLEMFKFARENGFNKIAFGHSLDDIVETVLLNMFFKSEIASMMPIMKYKKFDLTIIRPLATLEEKMIIKFVREFNIPELSQWCHLKGNTRRQTVKDIITSLDKITPAIRKNIIKAISNINYEYLPEKENEIF